MRGLKKITKKETGRTGEGRRHTSRLLDQLGPEGKVGEKVILALAVYVVNRSVKIVVSKNKTKAIGLSI